MTAVNIICYIKLDTVIMYKENFVFEVFKSKRRIENSSLELFAAIIKIINEIYRPHFNLLFCMQSQEAIILHFY